MFRLTLQKKSELENNRLNIQFPSDESELQEILDASGIGISVDKNCLVVAVGQGGEALQMLAGQYVNADEVQYLARRMESFDQRELQTFYAAAQMEKRTTVKELINLTFNLNCYCLISDFTDTAAVGKNYELSRQMMLSQSQRQQIDFAGIGSRLMKEQEGFISSYGVLYSTGSLPEQVHNGRQFPQYSYQGNEAATVTLETEDIFDGIRKEYLNLPCHAVEIKKALCRLGLDDFYACRTTLYHNSMGETVCHIFTEDDSLSEHLDTLNRLAHSYIEFDEGSRDGFHAVVDLVMPKTPEDVALLAENFYEFIVVKGIKTAEEYGRYMIMDLGPYDFDENLEEFIDFKGYGEQRIQKENGCFTEYGYFAYLGTVPEIEELYGQKDSYGMEGFSFRK